MTLSSLTIRSRLRTSHLGFLFMSCGCCAGFYVTTTLANSIAFKLSASRSLKRLAGITIANGVLHHLGNATLTVPCIKMDSQVNLIASSRSSCNCLQFLKPTAMWGLNLWEHSAKRTCKGPQVFRVVFLPNPGDQRINVVKWCHAISCGELQHPAFSQCHGHQRFLCIHLVPTHVATGWVQLSRTPSSPHSGPKYYTSNKATWRCSHLHCWQTRQVAYSSKGRVDAGLDFTRK